MKKTILLLFLLVASLCLSACEVLFPSPPETSQLPIFEEPFVESTSHEHSYGAWQITKTPTCSEAGEQQKTCICGEVCKEPLPMKTYTPDELFEYVEGSVAEITVYNQANIAFALGSGFVYSADGKIVTNYHVIESGTSATVNIQGTSYPVAKVLTYDKTIDIAVLQIDASDLPVVPVCSAPVKTGSTVYAIGSSQGLTATISNGIVSHAAREMDGVTYVQHNAAISSGNSGGPLVNAYGEVIGINTFTIRDSQNLNFAIFVSELDKLKYDNSLTMPALYEKECDSLTRIKNYIKTTGISLPEAHAYRLLLGNTYSADYKTKYSRYLFYEEARDLISFNLSINDGEYWVYFEIDQIDGTYTWEYFDTDCYILGTLTAKNFQENTLLGYAEHNISSANTLSDKQQYASDMMRYLVSRINQDLEKVNVTAKDLGFAWY